MNNRLPKIDINCDLGQTIGIYNHDKKNEALLPYITSVNIACGEHAGNESSILEALELARKYNLKVGAHIGFSDKENFGRKDINYRFDDLKLNIIKQINLLQSLASSTDIQITHIRPHAALAYKIASDRTLAIKIGELIGELDPWLHFVGPAGTYLNAMHEEGGIFTIGEVYLDKSYRRDNSKRMTTYDKHKTLEFGLNQASAILDSSKIIVDNGKRNRISYRSININNHEPYSLELATKVHDMLVKSDRLEYFHPYFKDSNIQPMQDFQSIPSLYCRVD